MAKKRVELTLQPQRATRSGVVAAVAGVGGATVDARQVVASPRNPPTRIEGDEFEALVASVREVGVIQPVVVISAQRWLEQWPDDVLVQGSEWVAVAGNRRLAAAKAAERWALPIVVRDDLVAHEAGTMLTENMHRLALSPIEEAQAFRRMVDAGHTQSEVARQVAVSQGQVAKRLSLLKLGEHAQQAVHEGRWTYADATAVMGESDEVRDEVDRLLGEKGDARVYSLLSQARSEVALNRNRPAAQEEAERLGAEYRDDSTGLRWEQRVYPRDDSDARALAEDNNLVLVPASHKDAQWEFYRLRNDGAAKTPSEQRDKQNAAGRTAARASRLTFLRDVYADRVPSRAALHQLLVQHTIAGRGLGHDARVLAAKITGEPDPYNWHGGGAGERQQNRAAWVALLASAEASLGSPYGEWGAEAVAWLDAMIEAGYQPTEWERITLDTARAKLNEGSDQ